MMFRFTMMRAIAVAAACALIGGCGSTSTRAPSATRTSSPTASVSPGSLKWGECPSSVVDTSFQCATLRVPLDYDKPQGEQITLQLSRQLHTSPTEEYLGPILLNPGGPGGSGLNLPNVAAKVPGTTASRFDWIGWDPRGVGESKPSLRCNPNYFGGDRPRYDDPREEKVWLDRAADYAKACAQGGALLRHMTTEDNARDMDAIRAALGQDKISYYGYSWGSYLGQVYLTLFPDRVRRVVLDGVVDPRAVWSKANDDQSVAFERSIGMFFAWVARNHAVYGLGTTQAAVYAAYERELDRLTATPAAKGRLGPDELSDVILNAGYVVYDWDVLASALSTLIRTGNGERLLEIYLLNNAGADNENGYAVYSAVQCTDAAWPNWAQARATAERIDKKAPFETWANAWFNAPCLTWSAPAQKPVTIKAAASLPSILLMAETYDAATPFTGAIEARRIFPTASLIEGVDGTTHAGSLHGVACVDDTIARYLATGVVPQRVGGDRADLRCPAVQAPAPKADQG